MSQRWTAYWRIHYTQLRGHDLSAIVSLDAPHVLLAAVLLNLDKSALACTEDCVFAVYPISSSR